MNLFVTSPDPVECALALDSRRLVKAVLETAQLLSTASRRGPYRPTHRNHPITRWVCARDRNYNWTRRHFEALCSEFTFRFHKPHSCQNTLVDFEPITDDREPDFFQNSARNKSLDLDFTHMEVFEAYRSYLRARWELEFARAAVRPYEYFDGTKLTFTRTYPAPTWHNRGCPVWKF